ncbi:MAG: DUF2306 domain-containing protein [Alphaproteobacteria bacterium]|nr:DUF2306 domain-containing protein [Alphaproteobacteria bacterium]
MTVPLYFHLATAFVAVPLGIYVLSRQKGTRHHKLVGRIWVAVMLVVALSSFWITGLNRDGSMSWIHILSIITLISLVLAIWAIRHDYKRLHIICMINTFIGLCVAGTFTLLPNRVIGEFVFG